MRKERRRRFLVNKALQFRYMAWILLILLVVTGCVLTTVYFGTRASLFEEFTDIQTLADLFNATRIHEYELALLAGKGVASSTEQAELLKKIGLFSNHQREIFDGVIARILKKLSWQLGLLFALIGVATIFLSHKIAGPLYRFEQSFKELQKKNLTLRIQLRKFDEALPLAKTFNQMAETLDKSISRLKNLTNKSASPSDFKDVVSKELSQFKTSADQT